MATVTLADEFDRRKSTTARMLSAFKKYGSLNTKELQSFGTGCSSRVHELRKEGWIITAVYIAPGFYKYVFKGQREETELPADWAVIKAQASEGDDSNLAVVD